MLEAKHISRSTPYAAELARAEFAECRIERIFVRETLMEGIRFSDWRGGRFNPRALEIDEDELIVLLGDAIALGVFSAAFLCNLRAILDA